MADDDKSFTADSFYAYLRDEKRMMGVRCKSCGKLSVEPRPMCHYCHGNDMEWHELSGKGSLSAFTCISIVPVFMGQKGHGRDNPYCTGIVALDEGPHISGRIVGVDASNPQSIEAGMKLVLDHSEMDPDKPSLVFRPE